MNLTEAEAHQAEILRAAQEGREPDFTNEANMAATPGQFVATPEEPESFGIRGPGQEVAEVTADSPVEVVEVDAEEFDELVETGEVVDVVEEEPKGKKK